MEARLEKRKNNNSLLTARHGGQTEKKKKNCVGYTVSGMEARLPEILEKADPLHLLHTHMVRPLYSYFINTCSDPFNLTI
jgi:hypothetical protein